MSTITPLRISQLVQRCKDQGPLSQSALTAEELGLMEGLYARVDGVASLATELNVRLMVDAEQSYFQPAIDALVLRLQREHNKARPSIFNTHVRRRARGPPPALPLTLLDPRAEESHQRPRAPCHADRPPTRSFAKTHRDCKLSSPLL